MQEIAVRDLKTHLSRVLAQVRAGTRITVTAHRKPVATIEPLASAPGGLPLIAGVTWRECPADRAAQLGQHRPAVLAGDGASVSELLLRRRGA